MTIPSMPQYSVDPRLAVIPRRSTALDLLASNPHLGSLSGDTLMAFAAAQLNDIDREISGQMQRQRTNKASATALSELLQALRVYSRGTYDPKDTSTFAQPNKEQCKAMNQAFEAALEKVPKGSAEHQRLSEAYAELKRSGTGDGVHKGGGEADYALDEKEVGTAMATVSDIQKDLTSGSELDMIDLQAKISGRQQVITMVTGMTQSLSQALQKQADAVGG